MAVEILERDLGVPISELSGSDLADELAVNLSTGAVNVQMVVTADDPSVAFKEAFCALHTAIHKTGGQVGTSKSQSCISRRLL